MVLPQHDPGPAGGTRPVPNPAAPPPIGPGASGALTAITSGVRAERGDPSMIGKAVRIKFPQRVKLFTFPVNPRQVQIRVSPRIEVTQSLTGGYVDSLGKGLGSGSISGTCGWGVPYGDPGQGLTGLQRTLELKRLYEEWLNETVRRTPPSLAACDLFIDFQQGLYQVVWGDADFVQSESSPFTIQYTLPFTILYDYNSPVIELPLRQLDAAGAPANDGGTPIVQPGEILR